MANTYTSCLVHLVFSTKSRANLIPAAVKDKLWAYIGGIARQHDMKALAVGGTSNHAHVLVSIPPTITIAKAAQAIKGTSSKWVHDTLPQCADFAWQDGYGAFTIGVSGIETTVAYIESQEAHHQTTSFEDEYLSFLRKHGIEYDPRYVWG